MVECQLVHVWRYDKIGKSPFDNIIVINVSGKNDLDANPVNKIMMWNRILVGFKVSPTVYYLYIQKANVLSVCPTASYDTH